MLCGGRLGVKSYTHVVEPGFEISEADLSVLEADMGRLLRWEPIQYVLGCTEFCGHRFAVGPGVLVPRPETEQLVAEAVRMLSSRSETSAPARVLDLCTGSGCIAWSIALELPGTSVCGVDNSPEALAVAAAQFPSSPAPDDIAGPAASPAGLPCRAGSASGGPGAAMSACRHGAGMPVRRPGGVVVPDFVEADVLEPETLSGLGQFDLVTANPPYVTLSEKSLMRSNVLDYEPHAALFVSDDDPLVFYRAIARISKVHLAPGGRGIVEINEALGGQTAALFVSEGYPKTEILKDYFGKSRFIVFSE